MYYRIDYTYMIFALPALLLSLWASSAVKSRFAKYDRVPTKKGMTGAETVCLHGSTKNA
ncbi:MAG: zinc metallopeptidase [Treponema sp.]|nr:zinc metallopeptidase [Treponema sp.]